VINPKILTTHSRQEYIWKIIRYIQTKSSSPQDLIKYNEEIPMSIPAIKFSLIPEFLDFSPNNMCNIRIIRPFIIKTGCKVKAAGVLLMNKMYRNAVK
jgi:hypothetical protein